MDYKLIIKSYMKQHNVSYADLANKMGVSRQRVWNILNTDRSINLKTLERICEALGLEIGLLGM